MLTYARRTNYIQLKINNTQNSKCKLCSYRDEMVNPKISQTSKIAKKGILY